MFLFTLPQSTLLRCSTRCPKNETHTKRNISINLHDRKKPVSKCSEKTFRMNIFILFYN